MRSPVDFYSSQIHYQDHLLPIWDALGGDAGIWHVPTARQTAALVARGVGVARTGIGRPRGRDRPVVVASGGDARGMRTPTVLVEHGAGQAYDVDHPSYSGGSKRDGVAVFLCPNEVVADRNAIRYPEATVAMVGSPRVDALRSAAGSPHDDGGITGTSVRPQCRGTGPVAVALSFHWDCRTVAPEAGWALPHFREALPEVVRKYHSVGHGHPRFATFFHRLWAELGVAHVVEFVDLIPQAWVYVCDNSSSMYEWAAIDRPVVVLNSPTYRREVEMWPRFWACADVGIQVDEPGDLAGAVWRAATDEPAIADRRREVVAEIYPMQDGYAAERSAEAIRRAFVSAR
jgi:hypothetical protein